MRKLFFFIVICFFMVSSVWAHGGRTDACGGHNDRKRGGYHIHNYPKYCACYPDAPECKKNNIHDNKTTKKKIKKGE